MRRQGDLTDSSDGHLKKSYTFLHLIIFSKSIRPFNYFFDNRMFTSLARLY